MTKTKKCGLIIGAVAAALAIIGTSFALWATTLTGNGSVSASGNWQVEITDAALSVSSKGAAVSTENAALTRANIKDDTLVASTISSHTWLSSDKQDLIGTQSGEAMSEYTRYYAVDTTKYDLSRINYFGKDEFDAISTDESTFVVSDHLNAYYRYVSGLNDGSAAAAQESAAKVVDGLIRDTEAALKELYPDTWRNYALVYVTPSNFNPAKPYNYVIANMHPLTADFTATEVTYADVAFSMPGAWAQYSVTITNNGAADANLEDAVIRLDTENKDQLGLNTPDLTGKTLAPGESCTITAVVKALDNGTGTLNASGRLIIELPYVQSTVEPAPDASYTK